MPVELLFLLIGLVPVLVVFSPDHVDAGVEDVDDPYLYTPENMEAYNGSAAALKSDMIADLASILEDHSPLPLTPGQVIGVADEQEPTGPASVFAPLAEPDLLSDMFAPEEEPYTQSGDLLVIDHFNPDEDIVLIDHHGSLPPELESQIVDPEQGVMLNFSDGSMVLLAGLFAVLSAERIAFRELTEAA